MAVTKSSKKNAAGPPSQFSQSSRKGKKAWRKNVDIGEVEEGLEEARAEERETGSTLRSKANEELFQIDVKGDNNIRKRLPKFDKFQLSYVKALNNRSSIPVVLSRATLNSQKKYIRITQEDKKRLLRVGHRKRLGPFNSIEDTTQLGHGSALLDPSHAVKQSGTYDVWASQEPLQDLDEGKEEFVLPLVERPPVKSIQRPAIREEISVPAVVPPHAGASYNPPVTAHQELLRVAGQKVEKEEQEAEKYAKVKEKMDAAIRAQSRSKPGVPAGMEVDSNENAVDEVDTGAGELPPPKKPPVRKTKQQRKKAEKLHAENRALAERAARKRFLASLDELKRTKKSVETSLSSRERARLQRRLLLGEKLKKSGLAGKRVGKHVVPVSEPEVQLGEDLSESLRELKVEGNLFRDRFLSLQQRALVEPRKPVLPKRHRTKTKEVEKFAWKRFE